MWTRRSVLAAPLAAAAQQARPLTSRENPTRQRPRRVVLDVDPGIDDALALLLALRSPELQVEALTVVAGNVTAEMGARNALQLLELAGRTDIPVARGATAPMMRRLVTAESVHGPNGLGGIMLPEPRKRLDPRHGVDLLIETVLRSPGEITLLPVGPLTNIAMAFLKAPEIRKMIPEMILMGGSIIGGNTTPSAEANIYNDPEAAKIVFDSGVPIVMCELGSTTQTRLTRKHLERWAASKSTVAQRARDIVLPYIAFSESRGFPGAALHDPLAVALAIDKSLAVQMQAMRIDVETKGEFTYGETVANKNLTRRRLEEKDGRLALAAIERIEPNAELPVKVDSARLLELLLSRLES